MEIKTCRSCKIEKPLTEYFKDKAFSCGYKATCKDCSLLKRRDYQKEYHEKNKERLNDYSKEWRKTNKVVRSEESIQRQKDKNKERYRTDPEYRVKCQEQTRKRRFEGKNKIIYIPRDQMSPEKLDKARAYHNAYYKHKRTTEEYKTTLYIKQEKDPVKYVKLYSNNERCRMLGIEGEITTEHIRHLYRWQEGHCYTCNKKFIRSKERNSPDNRTLEHLIPINDRTKGSNNPYNVVLSCGGCNYSRQWRLYNKEWLPPTITYPRNHFLSPLSKEVDVFLSQEKIELGDNKIFILSSFWGSERYNADKNFMEKIKDLYPSSLIFWDFEWIKKSEIIKNMIRIKFGETFSKGARHYKIMSIGIQSGVDFLNTYHLQGNALGSVNLVLIDPNNDIGGMATFKEFSDRWELSRLSFKDRIQGGTSKIIFHFMANFSSNKSLYTFVDPRYGSGESYIKTGFKELPESEINSYGYISPAGYVSRNLMMKNRMENRLDWFDPSLSEVENARINGWFRIFSLKQKKFILR